MFSDFKILVYNLTKNKLKILEAIYYRLNLSSLEERYDKLLNAVSLLDSQVSTPIISDTYIIAHAHSPEGKELGQFHLGVQLGEHPPIDAPKVYIDDVYKFSTPTIRENHEFANPVKESGRHNIKCVWNGITVDLGNVNIQKGKITTITFNFPRTDYNFEDNYFLVGGNFGGSYTNFTWFDANHGVSKFVSTIGVGSLIQTNFQNTFHGDVTIYFYLDGWVVYLAPQNVLGYTTYNYNPNQSIPDDYAYSLRPESLAAWIPWNIPSQQFNYWFCDTEQIVQDGGYPNLWLDWYWKYPLIFGSDIFQSHPVPALADTNMLLFKGPDTTITSPFSILKTGSFRDRLSLSSIPKDLQGIAF